MGVGTRSFAPAVRASPAAAHIAVTDVSNAEEITLSTIEDHRAFYANFVVRSGGSSSENLIAAFAATRREQYVGGGPWSIFCYPDYISTVSDDPRLLYQDVVVGIASDRGINNGQPSLHARCLAACAPNAGESVIHIGAGTGYYTAILAALVGSTGPVSAYEIEIDLASRARDNLRHLSNVTVVAASASQGTLPRADVIYVNAGATHPLKLWLDALKVGGRLIFPMTTNSGFGVMLLITCRSTDRYAASVLSHVAFIPCVGARDDAASQALSTALQSRSLFAAKSLHRGGVADDTACCVGADWWLSSAEPA
jgi:protein-L-isoaspartate(D-aspartate) O-methyltransferase